MKCNLFVDVWSEAFHKRSLENSQVYRRSSVIVGNNGATLLTLFTMDEFILQLRQGDFRFVAELSINTVSSKGCTRSGGKGHLIILFATYIKEIIFERSYNSNRKAFEFLVS